MLPNLSLPHKTMMTNKNVWATPEQRVAQSRPQCLWNNPTKLKSWDSLNVTIRYHFLFLFAVSDVIAIPEWKYKALMIENHLH